MLPWKSFVRAVSITTLLTAGAMAAGQDVLPFSHVSRSTAPAAEEEPTVDPAAEEETPAVDPAAEGDDTTTTTSPETETPKPEAPAADGDTDPVVPEVEVPESTTTTTVVTVTPELDKDAVPPAASDHAEPKDCAALNKGDHNGDGHCDNGWRNKDRDWWMDRHGVDKPANYPGPVAPPASTPAPAAPEADGDAKPSGDHNGDGHADNGKGAAKAKAAK